MSEMKVGINAKVTADTKDLEQQIAKSQRDLSKKTTDLGNAGVGGAKTKETLKAERDALAALKRESRRAAQEARAEMVKIFGQNLSTAQAREVSSAWQRMAARSPMIQRIGSMRDVASGAAARHFGSTEQYHEFIRPRLQRAAQAAGIDFHAGGSGGAGSGGGRVTRGMTRAAGAAGGVIAGAMTGYGDGGLFGSLGTMAGSLMGAGVGMLGGPVGMVGGALVGSLAGGALGGIGRQIDQAMAEALQEGLETSNLRRSLGEASISFERLNDQTRTAAKGMGIAYTESAKYASMFARTSNLKSDQAGQIGGELRSAYGFGRGHGIDPGNAVSFFAQMRLTQASTDEKSSRRIGLSVAEAIQRGGMGAKTDEVLSAIAGFAQSSTQQAFRAPNVEAFASMLASANSMNLPGLDPSRAASMLMTADDAMRRGGNMGMPSNVMTMAALSRGTNGEMSAYDIDAMQQGGLFSTRTSTFGKNSMRYKSIQERLKSATTDEERASYQDELDRLDRLSSGPGNDTTALSSVMSMYREQYGSKNTGAYYKAISNHFGLSIDQAEVLDRMNTNDPGLGSLKKKLEAAGVNTDKMNMGGIANMAQISTADAAGLQGYAKRLRDGKEFAKLSDEEATSLSKAEAGGTESLRNTIFKLMESRGSGVTAADKSLQVQTDLKDEMIKFAGSLLPLTASMKEGILTLVQKLAPDSPLAKQIEEEKFNSARATNEKKDAVAGYDKNIDALTKLRDQTTDPAKREELDRSIKSLQSGKAALVGGTSSEDAKPAPATSPAPAPAPALPKAPSMTPGSPPKPASSLTPEQEAKLAAADSELGLPPGTSRSQMQQESGFRADAVSKAGAVGWMQIMPKTQATLEKRAGKKFDATNFDDALTMRNMVMRENLDKFGNVGDALRAYNGGWDRSRWGNSETSNYAGQIMARVPGGQDEYNKSVPPVALAANSGGGKLRADVVVTVVDDKGRPRNDVTAALRNVTYTGDPAGSSPT